MAGRIDDLQAHIKLLETELDEQQKKENVAIAAAVAAATETATQDVWHCMA
jgi:hypothetical protein